MAEHQHHRPHDHRHAPGGQEWGELGDYLELEAEVLSPLLLEAISVLQALAARGPVEIARIVDVGCGTGVAAAALAQAFPGARVVGLDRSADLLVMARERAARFGLGDRVTTVEADLEAALGEVGPVDLGWASMVLHHLEDPGGLLRQLHAAIRPGGLLALVEFGPTTRSLPDELGFGAPGFTRRHDEAAAAAIEAHLPPGALGRDWPATLRAAGFEVLDHRTIVVDLPAPLAEVPRRWVQQRLRRSLRLVHDRLSANDLATLDVLTDPTDPRGVLRRTDVEVHAGRSLFAARRTG